MNAPQTTHHHQTNARILNWATWARDHKIIPISCKSLEASYKSPPVWDYPQLKAEIDILDAIEIEKILTAPTFPKANMACIVYSHIYPWLNFQAALRKINRFRKGLPTINPNNYKEFELKSERMLLNRVDFSFKLI